MTRRRDAAHRRRTLVAGALALGAIAAPAGVALADPARPTDYRSRVVSVEPETPQIEVDIIAGDAFVRLRVLDPDTDVVILGNHFEEYVRILPGGEVQQNRRSPSIRENASLDAALEAVPDDAGALAEWETIGSGGVFIWHDHNVHWMSPDPPPTGVAERQIRLEVDGRTVTVNVETARQNPPSRAPTVAGAVVAGFAALILLSVRRRQAWLLAVGGVAAAGIGWWQYSSLPEATGPSPTWFALPAIAAAAGLLALVFGRTLLAHALVLLGGLQLAVWVYLRRDGFARAILPTDAPGWLDRGVTAAAGVAAVVAVAAGGVALFRLPPPAAPEPRRAARNAKPKAKSAKSPSRSAAGVTTWGRSKK